MAATSGRLCGHYPDLATRGRGHCHSDFAGIFAAARGGWLKRVFFIDQTSEHFTPNTHRPCLASVRSCFPGMRVL